MRKTLHKAGLWLGALMAALGSGAAAQAETEADAYGVAPWSEAVISVSDFEPATRLFREVGHWRLVRSGHLSRAELDYWKLSPRAGGTFEKWCAPQADTGCLRFVRFTGVEQQPIRPGARAWDTGGIFSIMVRSDNVPALYEEALAIGWWVESPPIRFQFGTSDLRNMVLKGPHGINIAVYERITPDFPHFPVGRISQGFNSMRMVKDWNASRDYWHEVMGFGILFSGDNEPAEPAYSNFSIPYNLTPDIKRAASALFPTAGETGRVEPMQIVGFEGHDHSAKAVAPNLGILSVRFPVRDLAGYRAKIAERGAEIVQEREGVEIDGIGTVTLFAVRSPNGSLAEFYSMAEAGE